MDIITYDHSENNEEFTKGLKIGKGVELDTTRAIRNLLVQYWNCFCNAGAKRIILDYEFAIDTGLSFPICCRKPSYSPHEHPIIMN